MIGITKSEKERERESLEGMKTILMRLFFLPLHILSIFILFSTTYVTVDLQRVNYIGLCAITDSAQLTLSCSGLFLA